MIKYLATLLLFATLPLTTWAQMTFGFSTAPVSTTTLQNGTQQVTFPDGTKLNDLITHVLIDGVEVAPSSVSPDPTTTTLRNGELEVFVHDGRAYSFVFKAPAATFTAVIMSDPHIEQGGHDGVSVAEMQSMVQRIIATRPAIVFCLGDMDKDSENSASDFTSAFRGFNDAGVPFITMCGNHDLVPDYWEGGDRGVTYGGGHTANMKALDVVSKQIEEAKKHGVTEVVRFHDSNLKSGTTQFDPFVVNFRGVNFYCGQTYWFQKPYTNPGFMDLFGKSPVKYWAPDGVIAELETFVRSHGDVPSVWMQHYPFLSGSDCDRWWLDECKPGTVPVSDATQYSTPRAKKLKYAQLINMTTNPVHFSGHTHTYDQQTYEGITDYTVAGPGYMAGSVYIVTLQEGVGVVKVERKSI